MHLIRRRKKEREGSNSIRNITLDHNIENVFCVNAILTSHFPLEEFSKFLRL